MKFKEAVFLLQRKFWGFPLMVRHFEGVVKHQWGVPQKPIQGKGASRVRVVVDNKTGNTITAIKG